MIAAHDWFGRSETQYRSDLVREAARDRVFLMNLRTGADSFKCTPEELPAFAEAGVQHLLANGAIVGRGEPGTPSWNVATEFNGASADVARRIVAQWISDPLAFDALVFWLEAKSAA